MAISVIEGIAMASRMRVAEMGLLMSPAGPSISSERRWAGATQHHLLALLQHQQLAGFVNAVAPQVYRAFDDVNCLLRIVGWHLQSSATLQGHIDLEQFGQGWYRRIPTKKATRHDAGRYAFGLFHRQVAFTDMQKTGRVFLVLLGQGNPALQAE